MLNPDAERTGPEPGSPGSASTKTPNGSDDTAAVSHVGGYLRSAKLKKRAVTHLDTFEIFHIRRDYNLNDRECWTLLALVLQCDWRNGDWFGSLTELGRELGTKDSRHVRAAIDGLEAEELVQIVEDFHAGRHSKAWVRVLALQRLVPSAPAVNRAHARNKTAHVIPRNRTITRNNEESNPASIEHQSGVNPASTEQICAITHTPTSADDTWIAGEEGVRLEEELREESCADGEDEHDEAEARAISMLDARPPSDDGDH
jgi:hypothetical protein